MTFTGEQDTSVDACVICISFVLMTPSIRMGIVVLIASNSDMNRAVVAKPDQSGTWITTDCILLVFNFQWEFVRRNMVWILDREKETFNRIITFPTIA
jgi:hypothetical protein